MIAIAIERELLQLDGIAKAVVNFSTEMVYVEFNTALWNQASLARAAASAEARAYTIFAAQQRS